MADHDELLTPGEVAAMFHVNAKTVTRWSRSGKLRSIKTIGGHRRYYRSEVERAVERSADQLNLPKPGPARALRHAPHTDRASTGDAPRSRVARTARPGA